MAGTKNVKDSKLKYDILLVPKGGTSINKVRRIDLKSFILFLVLAGVVAHIIFVLLLIYTPIRDYLPGFNVITHQESEDLTELKEKLEKLTVELEKLRSRNMRLSYIIEGKPIPTDKRLLDSNYMKEKYKKDSIDLFSKKPFSNNILSIWKVFISNIFADDSTTINSKEKQAIFYYPAIGVTTQDFNPKKGHYGIDIGVKRGTVVRAASNGIVVFADYTINDGNKIIISHPNGYTTIYKHLAVLLIKERDYVEQGSVIALSGNSGNNTTSPHLHFEIWKDNTPIDPKTILINYNEN